MIDLDDLETAFQTSNFEMSYVLDSETGEVLLVTDESRRDLERIYSAIDHVAEEQRDSAFQEALERSELEDWAHDAVLAAFRVDADHANRFLGVPDEDSRDKYRDMEDFIETINDEHLQEQLWNAIKGRGAFRRFKDMMFEHPEGRQRWFAYRDAGLRQRVLDWLAEEGIEPVTE